MEALESMRISWNTFLPTRARAVAFEAAEAVDPLDDSPDE